MFDASSVLAMVTEAASVPGDARCLLVSAAAMSERLNSVSDADSAAGRQRVRCRFRSRILFRGDA
jgi:hypothetical protein